MKRGVLIFLSVVAVLLIGIMAFLAYMGMFSSLEATERIIGPYTFVYEDFVGPYKDTGPVFDRVYQELAKDDIKTTLGIGIYFDDPGNVPAEKLRSQCGVIIDKDDLAKVSKLEEKYKVGQIEKGDSVVVEFPIKNMLSYMIGPMKSYPIMTQYTQEKGYTMKDAAFEIYDMPSKKILFVWQIEK